MRRVHRLGSSGLIRRAYQSGSRARTASVAVAALVEGDGQPQVAVVASRRVGGAVVRNRARRRLRAAAAPLLGVMKPGSAVVLTAVDATPSINFQILEADVRRALEKARVIGDAGA